MGKKGSVGEVQDLHIGERIERIGYLLTMLGVASVDGDVPDSMLPLTNDIHRPNIALGLVDSSKYLPKYPGWLGYSTLRVTL